MDTPALNDVIDLSPSTRFNEFDLVRLIRPACTDDGTMVPAGTSGTIVALWSGGIACEVEFFGAHEGLATVGVKDLELEQPSA